MYLWNASTCSNIYSENILISSFNLSAITKYKQINFIFKCFIVNVVDEECLRSKSGYEYTGTVAVTKSNLTCKNWSDTKYKGKLSNQRNYCRNPSKSRRPWCYAYNPTRPWRKWEYCSIPMCSTYTKQITK